MYPQTVNTVFVALLQGRSGDYRKNNSVSNFPRTLQNNIKQRALKKHSIGIKN